MRSKIKIGILIIVFVVITAFTIRYIKRKKMQIKQCKYFNTSEFDSPDVPGSGKNMQHSTLLMLCEARKIADVPFKINSGYRTEAHNSKVGGVTNSAHLKGYAADISTPNGKHQEKILEPYDKRDSSVLVFILTLFTLIVIQLKNSLLLGEVKAQLITLLTMHNE